jgi:hypothetical protein
MKRRVLKILRNVLIGASVLTVLLVGAGLAYTWYVGQQAVVSEAPVADEPVATVQQQGPHKPAPDAVVGISKQYITSPVTPGDNASLSVKTNAEASCEITVTYGKLTEEDKQSTDSGLRDRVADEYGLVSWTWTVESSRPLGTWPVEVTCANEEKSAYLQVDLVLSND